MSMTSPSLEMIATTGNTLHGASLGQRWMKEHKNWSVFAQQNDNYRLPALEVPQSGHSENKALFSQDMTWSHDGTGLVAVHNDHGIRQYLVSLENAELIPFTRTFKDRSILCTAVHPSYSLYNEQTDFNKLITGCRDLPVQLYDLTADNSGECNFGFMRAMYQYNFVNDETSEYEVPMTLKFHDRDTFCAGANRSRISLFDLDRKDPLFTCRAKRDESNHRSIVSCIESTGVNQCVFGTYDNKLALADFRESGKASSLWNTTDGQGIYHLVTSENDHYCYVWKRQSRFVDIIDLRYTSPRHVNSLKLPFKINYIKHRPTLDLSGNLWLGTPNSTLIGWSREVVEFGGIPSKGFQHESKSDALGTQNDLKLEVPLSTLLKSRINMVTASPIHYDVIATAESNSRGDHTLKVLQLTEP